MARILNPAGQWVNKEIAGPPNYVEWLKSWKIFVVGMRTLKAATLARLTLYKDKIEKLAFLYAAYWWIVAQGDMLMRGEQCERIYRGALLEDQGCLCAWMYLGLLGLCEEVGFLFTGTCLESN